jgi:hypothetical protein
MPDHQPPPEAREPPPAGLGCFGILGAILLLPGLCSLLNTPAVLNSPEGESRLTLRRSGPWSHFWRPRHRSHCESLPGARPVAPRAPDGKPVTLLLLADAWLHLITASGFTSVFTPGAGPGNHQTKPQARGHLHRPKPVWPHAKLIVAITVTGITHIRGCRRMVRTCPRKHRADARTVWGKIGAPRSKSPLLRKNRCSPQHKCGNGKPIPPAVPTLRESVRWFDYQHGYRSEKRAALQHESLIDLNATRKPGVAATASRAGVMQLSHRRTA